MDVAVLNAAVRTVVNANPVLRTSIGGYVCLCVSVYVCVEGGCLEYRWVCVFVCVSVCMCGGGVFGI